MLLVTEATGVDVCGNSVLGSDVVVAENVTDDDVVKVLVTDAVVKLSV